MALCTHSGPVAENQDPEMAVHELSLKVGRRSADQNHPLQDLLVDVQILAGCCTDTVVIQSVNLLDGIAGICLAGGGVVAPLIGTNDINQVSDGKNGRES